VPREWDAVVHLAAVSVPAHVTRDRLFDNARMTMNLLEHIAGGIVLVVSSSLVYKPQRTPLREDAAVAPTGTYGLSKVFVEALVPHFRHRLDVRIARTFNHIGPGMSGDLMFPSLLRRVRDLPPDARGLVMRGTDSMRDFVDVRDVVDAYEAILGFEGDDPHCFNVCSGVARSIRSIAEAVLAINNRSCEVRFESVPTSSDDTSFMIGDHTRLSECTGWAPRYSIEQTIRETANE
jgi:GDP-4-dehydro-6-deoxy-D-mannose reductase